MWMFKPAPSSHSTHTAAVLHACKWWQLLASWLWHILFYFSLTKRKWSWFPLVIPSPARLPSKEAHEWPTQAKTMTHSQLRWHRLRWKSWPLAPLNTKWRGGKKKRFSLTLIGMVLWRNWPMRVWEKAVTDKYCVISALRLTVVKWGAKCCSDCRASSPLPLFLSLSLSLALSVCPPAYLLYYFPAHTWLTLSCRKV